jgi:signal transduction histidine kinase
MLEVRDDGVGISSLPPKTSGEHLGMFGMRERARLLGGQLQIRPASPNGTQVSVRIPL